MTMLGEFQSFTIRPVAKDAEVFASRGFGIRPIITPVDEGRSFVASVTKEDRGATVRAEFLARSPEIAVHQLAILLAQPGPKRPN